MLRKCSDQINTRMCVFLSRRFIVTKNTHELLHVEAYEGVPEAMVPGTIEAGVALRG